MTNPDSQADGPQPPDEPQTSDSPPTPPLERFLARVDVFLSLAPMYVGSLALGVIVQFVLLFPIAGALLHGGAVGGVLYALVCGIPSSWILIIVLRRRREAAESGLPINPLEQTALLGFASTVLVYGLCAGAIAMSPR